MSGRDLTIGIWENRWGREGLWCRPCRRATPVNQLLLVETGRALLHCETCAAILRSGPTWLTAMPIALLRPVAAASAPRVRSINLGPGQATLAVGSGGGDARP